MDIIKIITILIIILLTFFIVFRMIQQRHRIYSMVNTENAKQESFTSSPGKTPLAINNISSANALQPLIEYVIKASYNSAYDGTNMTLLALDNVLSRGVRFLDFEVYSVDDSPYVAYSVDPTFSSLTSGNSLLLQDVLNEVVGNAFMGNVPNPRDPLFIHLRINTNCGLNDSPACSIYQQVGAVIQNTLLPKLYVDEEGKAIPVSQATILSDIAGKIVLVMDASINRDYKNYAVCDSTDSKTCYNLKNYVNIETGGTAWKKYKFTDFLNQTQNPLTVDSTNPLKAEPKTGTLSLGLVLPNTGTNVSNTSFPLTNIATYGVQTVALKYYKNDAGLKAYEEMFNTYKTAFLPLGFAVDYITPFLI